MRWVVDGARDLSCLASRRSSREFVRISRATTRLFLSRVESSCCCFWLCVCEGTVRQDLDIPCFENENFWFCESTDQKIARDACLIFSSRRLQRPSRSSISLVYDLEVEVIHHARFCSCNKSCNWFRSSMDLSEMSEPLHFLLLPGFVPVDDDDVPHLDVSKQIPDCL